jgi:diaminohydroxyphosphoribosylaminopyrimidine deaminase/5-amino-6-(5-phosphoribosylamino)uracil reductase
MAACTAPSGWALRSSMTDVDRSYMRRALGLARLGWGHTAPNPMVGAVVVRDGAVVGEGYHARYGEPHAEVAALSAAGDRARGATVYVSLEPCAHTGQTPPCADALIAAGVRRVVAAAADPSPVARGGLARLAAAGVETAVGIEEEAARELNAPFFHAITAARPWVTLKLALSLDGAITDARRTSGWITSEASRREVHRLRAGADAVAVGVGTVLADDPALTVREAAAPRVQPVRVVFDRGAHTPVDSQLVQTAREIPVVVIAEAAHGDRVRALQGAGVQVLAAGSLDDALRELRHPGRVAPHGIRSLLIEGGARLAGALWAEGLVDRLVIFQAPLVLGAGATNAFSFAPGVELTSARRLRIIDRRSFDDDLMTTYAL